MASRILTDMLGRTVESVPHQPSRVVSLCPSQTETLVHFGANVVGCTQWCVHLAAGLQQAVRVGGTKKVRFDRIRALAPDLIVCEKEENTAEMVAVLEKEFPTYVTDVTDYASALEMIARLGDLVNQPDAASALIGDVRQAFAQLAPTPKPLPLAYLIWKNPYMAVGAGTYIHSMLELAGFANVFASRGARYPVVGLAEITAEAPMAVLLSSEPYTFSEKDTREIAAAIPGAAVIPVDGELFSWYGSRMLLAPPHIRAIRAQVQALAKF